MTRLSIRVGIVAAAAAAMSSGAFLVFPAHADTTTCTSPTGPAVCVQTNTSGYGLGATVVEGTAPGFSDVTGASVQCYPGGLDLATAVTGSVSHLSIPVSGLTC
jgi:hypothetical protein